MKTKITFKTFLVSLIMTLMMSTTFAQWTSVSNGLPALTTVGVANVRDTLFTAVKNHGVYYSVNNGDNWTAWKHNSKLKSTNMTKLEGLALLSSQTEGNFLYIYGNSMFDFYFSQGGGTAFFNYNTPNEDINSRLLTENSDTDVKYNIIGTNNGVYYSTDDMKNWRQSTGLSGDALIVNDVQIDSNQNNRIFASTNDGMYESTDYGVSFSPFRNGINAGIKVYDNNFIVSTSEGIFFFNNNANTFGAAVPTGDYRASVMDNSTLTSYSFGNGVAKKIELSTSAINDITQTNISGGIINSCTYIKEFLFICTENGGVFRINRQTGLSVNDAKLNSISFAAFPNPSNGKLTLTASQPSTFELYSIKGKLIKSLHVDKQESYHLKLASGVYFLRKKGTKIIKKIIFN